MMLVMPNPSTRKGGIAVIDDAACMVSQLGWRSSSSIPVGAQMSDKTARCRRSMYSTAVSERCVVVWPQRRQRATKSVCPEHIDLDHGREYRTARCDLV